MVSLGKNLRGEVENRDFADVADLAVSADFQLEKTYAKVEFLHRKKSVKTRRKSTSA